MSRLWRMLREVFFRLKLYLIGVRFHEWVKTRDLPLIHQALYQLTPEHSINFEFYRLECIDLVLQRGKLVPENYQSYVVKASFSQECPEAMKELNDRCFFFNGHMNQLGRDEDEVVMLILDIYLDYVRTVLEPREALT